MEGADHAIIPLPVSCYLPDGFACVSERVSLVLLVLAQSPCTRLLTWLPFVKTLYGRRKLTVMSLGSLVLKTNVVKEQAFMYYRFLFVILKWF